jgi:hypothetical protein
MLVKDFPRGTLVEATEDISHIVRGVGPGMLGVVFEEANFHEECSGPMVRWFNGTCCNAYEWFCKKK